MNVFDHIIAALMKFTNVGTDQLVELRAAVDAAKTKEATDVAALAERETALEAQFAALHERVDTLFAGFDKLDAVLTKLLEPAAPIPAPPAPEPAPEPMPDPEPAPEPAPPAPPEPDPTTEPTA